MSEHSDYERLALAVRNAAHRATVVPRRSGCAFGTVLGGEWVAQLRSEDWTEIVALATRHDPAHADWQSFWQFRQGGQGA